MVDLMINNQYSINRKIGKGSYGDVYIGYDKDNKRLVAIKLEQTNDNLSHEYGVYKSIGKTDNLCIPQIYWFGKVDNYYVMVMQFLGNSLEYLLNLCHRKFSLKTSLMATIQMFDSIKLLHNNDFVHRDLKPDNFLIGINNMRHYVYIIDFGMSKRYKNANRVHISVKTGKKLIGTARYASVNSHLGIELSRRDDLESLGYILIYFLNGKLPWQNLPGKTRDEKYQSIGQYKQTITLQELCKDLPKEIYFYMKYVKSLDFKEKPNYGFLRSLLTNLMKSNGYNFDYQYDWTQK